MCREGHPLPVIQPGLERKYSFIQGGRRLHSKLIFWLKKLISHNLKQKTFVILPGPFITFYDPAMKCCHVKQPLYLHFIFI